jgi:mono/diheme cytochrome c family protein
MPHPRHVVALLPAIAFLAACQGTSTAPAQSPIERGKHLVAVSDCNICHTPKKMGPNGPEPDMSRLLSGHPADENLPPAPAITANPWMITAAASMTAWSGPWGVSYPANLTPDEETGIGAWDEKMFISAIRTGKHLGGGRDILPPMPWQAYREYSDEDLKAIFAYLRSIPPVKNQVPDPLPPAAPPAHG